ncbi:MAG: coenzyme F420-0:L-glutamate ligase [Ilumatobacteraceae bacterium]
MVLREAARIVRQAGPILITETHHGFVCANSGVDQSSSGAAGRLVLLPTDPDDVGPPVARRAGPSEVGTSP